MTQEKEALNEFSFTHLLKVTNIKIVFCHWYKCACELVYRCYVQESARFLHATVNYFCNVVTLLSCSAAYKLSRLASALIKNSLQPKEVLQQMVLALNSPHLIVNEVCLSRQQENRHLHKAFAYLLQ